MSDPATILSLYLGQVYAAKHLGKGNYTTTERLFRSALDADAKLRAEAERRLTSLSSIDADRCFITASHRSVLEKVLKEARA